MVREAVTFYLFFQFLLSTGHSGTAWLTLLLGDNADPLIISWSIVAMVIAYMHGILPKVLAELRIIPKMSNLVNLRLICLVALLW